MPRNRSHCLLARCAIVAGVLATLFFASNTEASAWDVFPFMRPKAHQPPKWDWSEPPCSCKTIYKTGPGSNDLQVHIVGRDFAKVEAYYQENLDLYSIPGGVDLCRRGAVLIPEQQDKIGTFAISYGDDGFTAFGWLQIRGDWKLIPLTAGKNEYVTTAGNKVVQIDLVQGYPIQVTWVTSRILKILHGQELSNTYILKFQGMTFPEKVPWQILYPAPAP